MKTCAFCRSPLTKPKSKRFCDLECMQAYRLNYVTLPKFRAGEITDRQTLRRLILLETLWHCAVCKNTTWQAQPIPLELDHKDGNAANNKPSNLWLICPNCHAQRPTAKGKNIDNGRKARGLPTH